MAGSLGKRDPRLFPPDRATHWDVGLRLGAVLRRAEPGAQEATSNVGAARARPRPHVRRAHWHTYRVGEGHRGRKVKWITPIPANVRDVGTLPATVQPVD